MPGHRQCGSVPQPQAGARAHLDRMDYAAAVRERLPIGSGITEAACKTIVKARLCGGGMRWHLGSMQQVLSLRALRRSSNRWDQFRTRLDRHGF